MLNIHGAIHPHNVLGSSKGLVVVEAGKDAVRDLLDDELIVTLALLALPKHAIGMAFHVFNVAFCAVVLIIREGDGEAGSYFLCVHSK